ncbi:hypothetical protein MauCBS54593_000251 [Microsporum audouinii]
MVMNMFLSSAKPDDTSNSNCSAVSYDSAPPTPLSTPIGEIPQEGQVLGEGSQQLVTLTRLKDLLIKVVRELKGGDTAVQSKAAPRPQSKPLGSKLEFKRVGQVWDKATRKCVNKEEFDELDQYAFVVRS